MGLHSHPALFGLKSAGKFIANDSEYILSNANALWVQKEYPLQREYTAIVDECYHGKAKNVDFMGAPDGYWLPS